MVNGGAYQDVGQLHVHLISPAQELAYECPETAPEVALLNTDVLTAFRHPSPRRDTHVVLLPRWGRQEYPAVGRIDGGFVDATIIASQELVRRLNLMVGGYTLLINARPGMSSAGPCFHLVAGGTLS
jgi:diadenosine tetraphosphate (Ap4A) HIT family hydrolase